MTQQDLKAFETVKKLFRNDHGQPFEMTEGQIALFRAIYEKQKPRTQFECYTQYGKSDTVSMAVLLRAATFPEKWIILGGTKDKAGIIMGKIIKHVFENEYTMSKFDIMPDESIERIKRERSKERLTFRVDDKGNMGEIMVLSADARRKGDDAGDILIGHGGPNLIEDDAALIPNPIHGKALRMLGGFPQDNFLLKITNSFGRNHAYRSSIDPNYHVLKIDYEQGIREGRITGEFIEEMRNILDPIMFGILYECKYPPADMVDDQGWMPLLTEEDIWAAQERSKDLQVMGLKRLGVDISEGTNYNAYVIRQDNLARVKEKTLEKDLMKTADHTREIQREEAVFWEHAFMDAIGVGAGPVARLHQMGCAINGIKVGEKPTEKTDVEMHLDPIEFYNLKAELSWFARIWIKQGGALMPHPDWMQLTKLRYKEDIGKRIKIMGKEEMRLRGLLHLSESPDVADAFILTFAKSGIKKINNVASPVVRDPYGQFADIPQPVNEKSFGAASVIIPTQAI